MGATINILYTAENRCTKARIATGARGDIGTVSYDRGQSHLDVGRWTDACCFCQRIGSGFCRAEWSCIAESRRIICGTRSICKEVVLGNTLQIMLQLYLRQSYADDFLSSQDKTKGAIICQHLNFFFEIHK